MLKEGHAPTEVHPNYVTPTALPLHTPQQTGACQEQRAVNQTKTLPVPSQTVECWRPIRHRSTRQ